MARDVLLYGISKGLGFTDSNLTAAQIAEVERLHANKYTSGAAFDPSNAWHVNSVLQQLAPEIVASVMPFKVTLPDGEVKTFSSPIDALRLYYKSIAPYKEAVRLSILYNLPAPIYADFNGSMAATTLLKYQTMAKNADMAKAATTMTTTASQSTAASVQAAQPTQVTPQPQPAPVATTTTTAQPTQVTPQPQPAPVATTPTTTAQPQPELVATLPSPDEVSTLTITQKEDEGVPWWAWGLLALAGVGGFLLIRRNKKKKQNK